MLLGKYAIKDKRNDRYLMAGGHFHQDCTWMCLPNLENLTFSIPIFHPITHPSIWYTIFNRKAPNFPQLGAFYNDLLKIHPI